MKGLHHALATINKLAIDFTTAICSASCPWIFLLSSLLLDGSYKLNVNSKYLENRGMTVCVQNLVPINLKILCDSFYCEGQHQNALRDAFTNTTTALELK
ncbi:hypothetical protein GOODEAATRI_000987 [Goodea atripinnis]|uniref:Uncharacterized protein n=1 Tax=Goodea atripinnis TaxID=208336 RepID=A0ABV0PAC1_9TELE